ncbi:hypothetical protein [Bacteroides sp.]|uniref:hypothetical protein n=1 Tax=Bacteroides sp. TaxID=29523 RepID=UPI00260E29CE|nr:hypothetical protein [Bacteroides sp.]MDD3040801.1 hypothetical protein [Bacteroides sp.]
MNSETTVLPEDRFTWEIVWDDNVFGPYGEATNNFYIQSGDPTVYMQLPYRQTINCTFNIVYFGQENYWEENYRTTPTLTEYEPCHYSSDTYKGCEFEFIVKLEVME